MLSKYPFLVLICGVLTAGFVPYKELFVIIVFVMIVDILSGIAVAIKNKCFVPKIAAAGIVKKLMAFILLVMAADLFSMKPFVISIDFLLWIWAGIEIVSCTENFTKLFGKDALFGLLNGFLTKIIRMKQEEIMKKCDNVTTSGSTTTVETKGETGTSITTKTTKTSKSVKNTPKKKAKKPKD